MAKTLWPCRLRPCANAIAVVVLPTPPLKLATAMVIALLEGGRMNAGLPQRAALRASATVTTRR